MDAVVEAAISSAAAFGVGVAAGNVKFSCAGNPNPPDRGRKFAAMAVCIAALSGRDACASMFLSDAVKTF